VQHVAIAGLETHNGDVNVFDFGLLILLDAGSIPTGQAACSAAPTMTAE